ncbi:polyhydroxyalkanoic acid system family protein [Xanthobacter tagetidis]|jgi:hypothetical protein|uniref:Polyhydroxyalkanoic acid synthase n=1 Tax=Xanthobacter tagetidis TaxID=60216 RepID=A0A3L7AJ73_9HYPH|nr:polyhydroxyalkanoic acid system family protein [Xanthobacter tagetidis]MBB6306832.1 hypothetical protein [Xanthobacter tagetidis]RLP80094.1 polyhydroxyalkanoic acid synthase [Xanthobacter tagetidis]
MAQPFTASVPHKLGREEATRRLQSGLTTVRDRFASHVEIVEERWTDGHLDFRVAVMGQHASGTLDVLDEAVNLSVELPFFLSMLANKAKDLVMKQGQILLEKK